jgi:hypothetical protein
MIVCNLLPFFVMTIDSHNFIYYVFFLGIILLNLLYMKVFSFPRLDEENYEH